jgi:RNA polymerase sigma factor (sigma-70 family)
MTAPDAENDAAVISRSLHEPEAFALLYDRHAAAIYRYVTRRLGDAHADDMVAECFLAAFRRRDRYDPARVDARPWLYGIAARVIGKHRRTEVRLLRTLARTGADPVAEDHSDRVDSRVTAAALQRQLAAALAELAAGDREVLLLIAWANLSYAQVAEALAIPVGTVRSRLSRARKKTRAVLAGHDPTLLAEELCT